MKRAPVVLRVDQRYVVGAAFVTKLHKMECDVCIVACGATHLHALFTITETDAIKQLGKAKQFASLKLTDHTGQLWGERSKVIPIRDELHLYNACDYIRDHAHKEEAWLWSGCVTEARTDPNRT